MRQLFPDPGGEVDLAAVYGSPAGLRLNMISSADGAATVGSKSGGLGGPADKVLFAALRGLCDVVLVAAGTVRAEGYGPARIPPEVREARQARGQTAVPSIAVISGSADLDYGSRFFTEAEVPPIVITGDAGRVKVERGAPKAEVLVAGDDGVDLARALAGLSERGLRSVLAEGGPSLNGQLLAAGLVDELCLTLAPRVVGGDARRIVTGSAPLAGGSWTLVSILEDDGFLFLRYLTPGREPA
jgi:riboflavin biosynthesis pyrimidine reductase